MRRFPGRNALLVIGVVLAASLLRSPTTLGQKPDEKASSKAVAKTAEKPALKTGVKIGELPADYSCSACHKKGGELYAEGMPLADEHALEKDLHWNKGLLCHDCHGGSPTLDNFKNHREDPSFRSIRSRELIPEFCGKCHSNINYMRDFNPSARTDQVAEYWTSGHGRKLKASIETKPPAADQVVAVCTDCHGGHGILPVKDPNSPVEPTHVAKTCARCHTDEHKMEKRTHNGRPLGTSQYPDWMAGVHGQAMFKKGDRSAPTCNDCHGNHGAMPPGIDSVANACGTCHGKVAKIFNETRMKHKFSESGLPGCATCHGAHKTAQPDDSVLGMGEGSFCSRCHNPQNPQYGATTAGADAAKALRSQLDLLKQDIENAEAQVKEAERKGMEVREPRFDLRQAFDALTNARTVVHSFKPAELKEATDKGFEVTTKVKEMAQLALKEHRYRRVWLAGSLVPLLLVVGLLVAYIRTIQPQVLPPEEPGTAVPE